MPTDAVSVLAKRGSVRAAAAHGVGTQTEAGCRETVRGDTGVHLKRCVATAFSPRSSRALNQDGLASSTTAKSSGIGRRATSAAWLPAAAGSPSVPAAVACRRYPPRPPGGGRGSGDPGLPEMLIAGDPSHRLDSIGGSCCSDAAFRALLRGLFFGRRSNGLAGRAAGVGSLGSPLSVRYSAFSSSKRRRRSVSTRALSAYRLACSSRSFALRTLSSTFSWAKRLRDCSLRLFTSAMALMASTSAYLGTSSGASSSGGISFSPIMSSRSSVTERGVVTDPHSKDTRTRAMVVAWSGAATKLDTNLQLREAHLRSGLRTVPGCYAPCRVGAWVGVKCPHIWVFGKIAYLLYPRPTMTTRLVQSKQPTYLPPPEKPRVLSYL